MELAVNRAFTTLSFGGAHTGVFGDGQNYTDGLGGVECINALNSTATIRIPRKYRLRITGAGLPLQSNWHPGSTALAPAVPTTWSQNTPGNCTTGARQMIYWNQLDENNIFVERNDLSGEPKSPAYNSVLGFADGAQHDIFVSSNPKSTGSEAGIADKDRSVLGCGAACVAAAASSPLLWLMTTEGVGIGADHDCTDHRNKILFSYDYFPCCQGPLMNVAWLINLLKTGLELPYAHDHLAAIY
ncbi:hypothetical protein DFH07DRAFT_1007484 [Mycena maculata]|uniref:Uncharacterized protein n=1 Tax=Mycena maculata TaxID=230809 RepID=A0AAD7HIW8_9AGAR|nr:hypothetical protein DFH07DRAFT_1007484 [Mycena maculata]